MISLRDQGGQLRFVNKEWERVLGRPPKAASLDDSLAQWFPDPEKRQEVPGHVLAASGVWHDNHFQLAMLAHNLNCWLMLFNREPEADATELRHTTLATSRLRFLFLAAKVWRHAGRTGVSYSDHYEEKGLFQRLMDRLRRIVPRGQGYAPVMHPALR